MDAQPDLDALRERLDDLERRRAEASRQLADAAVPGPVEQLEGLRFELAEVAWQLEELAGLAW